MMEKSVKAVFLATLSFSARKVCLSLVYNTTCLRSGSVKKTVRFV